jgi:hypothetical protein
MEISRTTLPVGTGNEKPPLAFVTAETFLPFTLIVADGRELPDFVSLMFPVSCLVCAQAPDVKNSKNARRNLNFLILISFLAE